MEIIRTESEEAEIVEHKRISDLVRLLINSSGPMGFIKAENLATILGIDVGNLQMETDPVKFVRSMMHEVFHTDKDPVKGIQNGNIYFGYDQSIDKGGRRMVDYWDYLPLNSHSGTRMEISEMTTGFGIVFADIGGEQNKSRLRTHYRTKGDLLRWERAAAGGDNGIYVDENEDLLKRFGRKTQVLEVSRQHLVRKPKKIKPQNRFVQGQFNFGNPDEDHARELHSEYDETKMIVDAITQRVGKTGGSIYIDELIEVVTGLGIEFEAEDSTDALKQLLGIDNKDAVNGRVAPYVLVDRDIEFSKKTGLVHKFHKWTFIPISGQYKVEFTPNIYTYSHSGTEVKIDQIQVDIFPVKNYGKFIMGLMERRQNGYRDPSKMSKKARKAANYDRESARVMAEEKRREDANLQGNFLSIVDQPIKQLVIEP